MLGVLGVAGVVGVVVVGEGEKIQWKNGMRRSRRGTSVGGVAWAIRVVSVSDF